MNTLDYAAKLHILKILRKNNFNREVTSKELDIDRKTLYRKINQMDLEGMFQLPENDNELHKKLDQISINHVTRKASNEKTEECPVYDSLNQCWIESDAQFEERIKKVTQSEMEKINKLEAIKEAAVHHTFTWPKELSSGVMFWNGYRITIDEFNEWKRKFK